MIYIKQGLHKIDEVPISIQIGGVVHTITELPIDSPYYTLRLIAVERSHKLDEAFNKAQKRVKRRERILWIVGAVAVIETVVIGAFSITYPALDTL